jgi:hypothetical protein
MKKKKKVKYPGNQKVIRSCPSMLILMEYFFSALQRRLDSFKTLVGGKKMLG